MSDQGQGDGVPAFEGPEPGVPVGDPNRPKQRRTDRMADEVGAIRRQLEAALGRVDRLAGDLESQDADQRPTAAELVKAGVDVERALAVVEGQQVRLWKRTGAKPR